MAQALLARYWERTKDLPAEKKKGIGAIQFGPDVPPEIRQLVWKKRS